MTDRLVEKEWNKKVDKDQIEIKSVPALNIEYRLTYDVNITCNIKTSSEFRMIIL